ncbi:hypothetical protein C3747_125g26 [Trypanosoma cruzi]|uniref:Uncharacterized protein n=2 Tax=Trypanosoma cruzi TaxID=5693 RepID=Q4DAD4_TRYCC|nr:hypothetical protein, conserved [Trypanosoma cruzi]EAN89485.1 hypothetical protein, conserved [Trypanosoma cruzi]KAF5223875.1 hypothetical protein ECC02_003063 [Trypanosoma cruzi]KAF8299756.1 hypothetical protein TcYC6_0064470 [Trypanosoma cruzi]PWV05729.1 hypothetical protein C3747_125g26 [Trypanosoma cruzi]RNC56428.1 hypothetical protein TcCL_ESM06005 [Trypanosoma cruzi]|eukprot:XP_811336.1 hypothetical protein [Trypanosoma cruzi strain CL Brener]
MRDFRYHMHIVDGGDPTSTVTAATLFAHLTLRCGQLRNHLLLSASTTDAKRQRDALPSSLNATRMVQLAAAEPSSGRSTDDKILLAAEALLRGDENFRASLAVDTEWSGPVAEVKDRIIPYPCFSCGFVQSEVFLARSGARYFDFIATADVASFNYLLNYYQAVRMLEDEEERARKGSAHSVGWDEQPEEQRRRKKVGIVHILCGEPARAGHLLQRFIELLLELDATPREKSAGEGAAGNEEAFAWISRADGVIWRMYQLLGVDVLFAVM